MCTGNLRRGTENLFHYLITQDKEFTHKFMTYFGLIFFFMTGAVTGSFFSEILKEKAPLVCCLILFSAFIIMFKDEI